MLCSWLLSWWWLWLIVVGNRNHLCGVDEWLLNAKAGIVMEGDTMLLLL
jgi:hypothetical protein